jgi:hypothetical protein
MIALLAILLWMPPLAHGQSDGLLDLNDDIHVFLERQQALGNLRGAFLDEQPLSARRARRYLDSLAAFVDERPHALGDTDRRLLARYRGAEPLPGATAISGRFGPLYRNGQDLYSVEHGPLRLQVNPRLYLSGGTARETDVAGETPRSFLFENTRSLRVTGRLGENFFFHSNFEESQVVEPMVARQRARERLPLIFQPDSSLFDYSLSGAAFGYQDRYVEVRIARGRERWGHALGSLYFSGHAPPHTSLQARLEVWRISYTAHYAVMDDSALPAIVDGTRFSPIKYAAFHRLGVNLPGRVSLGFFDGIIFAIHPDDERLGNYLNFFNPLIFYNTVDRAIGSPGNVLLGLDAHWVASPGVAVYSQLILDDFEAGQLFTNDGYWKNTWGALAGLHVVDPGVRGLDARLEYSRVRPYVYANVSGSLAYTQREGMIGAPAGPNSETLSLAARYRPLPRWRADLSGFVVRRGRSMDGFNFGDDPFVPYTENRATDDDAFILQGIRQTRQFIQLRGGYELLPAMWLEGAVQHETFADAEYGIDRATSLMVQLRWGMPPKHPLY